MKTYNSANTIKSSLLGGCALSVLLLTAHVAISDENRADAICKTGEAVNSGNCIYADAGTVVSMPTTENLEQGAGTVAPSLGGAGFSISIDGDLVAGDKQIVDQRRVVDLALEAANLQVKFDGFDVDPRLNVSTADMRTAYQPGTQTKFVTTTNYPAWIKRSELIIRADGALGTTKDVAKFNVGLNQENTVQLPADLAVGQYKYVLRVYDARGNYDETEPLPIAIVNDLSPVNDQTGAIVRAGDGEDRAAVRHINVHGGAVTVYGDHVANGSRVEAMGENVPVDGSGKFVMQRILPPGEHSVGVSVNGAGQNLAVSRDVEIPENDVFFFGVADATLGKYLEDIPEGEEATYATGRMAVYLKGRIRGEYLITAAADTGEGDLDGLLNGFDEKDPKSFLNRIDADSYYPVYGDDSTFVEDAPTSGKVYVRVEKDASYALWGNFKADIDGNQFVSSQRALYGAQATLQTQETNSLGEARAKVNAYAAQPERLQRRDTLRGTGGSAYFLRHQDITPGSETVTVQINDPDTGRVQSTRKLVNGRDYTVDYFQGVILLTQPLSSSVNADTIVSEETASADNIELVVNYENTPANLEVDDLSFGARAEAWLTNTIRLGASLMKEDVGGGDERNLSGLDVVYQTSDNTFIAIDFAQSEGRNYDENRSDDGGFEYAAGDAANYDSAQAQSFRAQADLAEMTGGRAGGVVSAFYETKEAGFFNESETITSDQVHFGVEADWDVSAQLAVAAKADHFENDAGKVNRESGVEAKYQFNKNWSFGLGATQIEKRRSDEDELGRRLDYAARITRHFADDQEVYAFAQDSANIEGGLDRNDRYGIGGTSRINDRLLFTGEVSDGSRGVGAEAKLNYQQSANSNFYIGYRLDPDRAFNNDTISGRDNGKFIVGGTSQVNERVTYYGETSYDLLGQRNSLTNAYGVTYTPNSEWTLGGAIEAGQLVNSSGEQIDRQAISLSATWADADENFVRSKVEFRNDEGTNGANGRDMYLMSMAASYRTNPNWRVLSNLDMLYSESDQADVLNGRYAEASLGYAYRPIDNDRINALVKYTYLYDLPGYDQVTIDGTTAGMAQRSHIMSADVNYDLNPYWTIGGKIGYRERESSDRAEIDWSKNTAYLGVIRADYHVTHNWDVLGEMRALHAVDAGSSSMSGLVGVYRHFGNNLKAGIGYDWGSFSDDLRSTTENNGSVFFNIVGKF